MKKIAPIALAGLCILLIFTGCSKDDPAAPQKEVQIPNNLRLSKVYVDGKLYREISYDQAGRIAGIGEYDNGDFDGSQTWKYNEEGQVSQRWLADAEGSFQVLWTYEYNENGAPRQWLVYKNLFDDPTYGAAYEYDTQGRLSARHFYFPAHPDEISSYIRYTYDDAGNLLSSKGYNVQDDAQVYLYLDWSYQYKNPVQIAAVREAIGKELAENHMYLYSLSKYNNYGSDGSIEAAYTATVDIVFNANGLPTSSALSSKITHPQADETTTMLTYEYIEL